MMKKKLFKFLLINIIIIIIAIIIIVILNKKVLPIYLNYAEAEMKRLVTTIINKSITKEVTEELAVDELFIIRKEENSNVTMVDFDPVIVNRVVSLIADVVYDNLKLVSKKDQKTLEKYNVDATVFYIPSGIIFNSAMLNNLGPKIPVNLEIISSVNLNLKTEITEYGINNSLVEVYIRVDVSVKMILPMAANNMQVTVMVPLAVKLIQGEVPKYYQGSNNSSGTLFFQDEP